MPKISPMLQVLQAIDKRCLSLSTSYVDTQFFLLIVNHQLFPLGMVAYKSILLISVETSI